MRILDKAKPTPPLLGADELPIKELKATCCKCSTFFGFVFSDEGVSMDNEGDYNVDCPSCAQPLVVGNGTGDVYARTTYEGDR